jgi:catechol 2,3-dioxygenase-like lactoylglutathione lyase family enzyme
MLFRAVVPQLAVADVARAQRWYQQVLDLRAGFLHERFAALSGPAGELYLCQGERAAQPSTCCARVDDADAAHAIARERGARIIEPLGARPWGTREFTLVDPDGNRFRIGHPTR